MNLEEVLPPGSVSLDVTVRDKPHAIAHAAAVLAGAAGISAEAIEAALLAREALGSTGVGGGVALPHARLHALPGVHAVFFRIASPVEFGSIDDRPVDLLCALVAPDVPNAALLTALAAVSRVLRDPAKTAALRQCSDADDARRMLLQEQMQER